MNLESTEVELNEPEIYETEVSRHSDVSSVVSIESDNSDDEIVRESIDPAFSKNFFDSFNTNNPVKKSRVYSSNETHLQKLKRLEIEISELDDFVKSDQFIKKTSDSAPRVDRYKNMADQVIKMKSDLSRIESGLSTSSGTLFSQIQQGKALLNDISTFRKETPQKQSNSDSTTLSYELFYTPETSNNFSLSKLSTLETRLAALENLIGTHNLKSLDTDDTISCIIQSSGSLVGAIQKLEHHLDLLSNPKSLDLLAIKLSKILPDLEKMSEARKKIAFEASFSTVQQSPNDQKINQIYETVTRMESTSLIVPHLVARLFALKTLHNEAAVFSDSIKSLRVEVERLSATNGIIDESLKKLDENDNYNVLASNFKVFEDRVEKLITRLAKLES